MPEVDKAKQNDVPVQVEYANNIRAQAISLAAKYTILAIVFLLSAALAGWWFYLKSIIPDIVGAVPKGAVMAFDLTDCPNGWESFSDTAGKVIVGVGQGEQLTPRAYRDRGGSEAIILSEENMPVHQHDTFLGVVVQATWGNGPSQSAVAGASMGQFATALTSPYGRQSPIAVKTMPPYLALYYCKKL